jgi:hypothetical protein
MKRYEHCAFFFTSNGSIESNDSLIASENHVLYTIGIDPQVLNLCL